LVIDRNYILHRYNVQGLSCWFPAVEYGIVARYIVSTISSGGPGRMRMTPGPNGGMQLHMTEIPMAALADRLTQFMDRPVVDATGLKGKYQVALDLPKEAMSGMAFAQKLTALAGLGPFEALDGGAPDTSSAPIIKSVKDLGLELEFRKALIETIIVDHMEKIPTAN
jgi:uncharacterized protein (TIGR03435 family)